MENTKVYRAIGLMSGTSLDGVDAALVETDGEDHVVPLGFVTIPYDDDLRESIRTCLGKTDRNDPHIKQTEKCLTEKHIEAVRALSAEADVIGFHGQTIHHDPENKITIQIGDGAMLARETGIDVVNDFRGADVRAGGQGAPLLPLYHRARAAASKLSAPLAILNIGGVANVTWINEDSILAFDTGPGNALIDDWVMQHHGARYDENGKHASKGKLDKRILSQLLDHPYFTRQPPKSLDRDAFSVPGLTAETGATTLSAFTVEAVKKSLQWFPEKPRQWLVAGGGRHNAYLMEHLGIALSAPVNPVEHVGWNGDALEAEGFAYLAVRSLKGLPLSLPTTTGVPAPQTGGILYKSSP